VDAFPCAVASAAEPLLSNDGRLVDRADEEGEPSASESDVDSDHEDDEEPDQAPPPSANKSPKVAEVPSVLARAPPDSALWTLSCSVGCGTLQAKAKAAPGSGRKRGRQHAEVQLDESATLLGAAHITSMRCRMCLPGKPDCVRPCWCLNCCCR